MSGIAYVLKVVSLLFKAVDCYGTYHKGLHRRAPCSRIHLAYSLRQLRVGISPPYALDPYN